mmetsp:Transcript_23754/g.77339  ORF Transcript_23754/g.77339 Transcript_23754/m.77339 type:complete len:267 (-) Transcript_23754:792-1592(-)
MMRHVEAVGARAAHLPHVPGVKRSLLLVSFLPPARRVLEASYMVPHPPVVEGLDVGVSPRLGSAPRVVVAREGVEKVEVVDGRRRKVVGRPREIPLVLVPHLLGDPCRRAPVSHHLDFSALRCLLPVVPVLSRRIVRGRVAAGGLRVQLSWSCRGTRLHGRHGLSRSISHVTSSWRSVVDEEQRLVPNVELSFRPRPSQEDDVPTLAAQIVLVQELPAVLRLHLDRETSVDASFRIPRLAVLDLEHRARYSLHPRSVEEAAIARAL